MQPFVVDFQFIVCRYWSWNNCLIIVLLLESLDQLSLCPLEVTSWQHSQQLYAGHKLQSEVLISFRNHLNIILSALICIRWRNFYFSLISFLLPFYVCNAQVINNCLQQVKIFLYKYISRPCWILTYNLLINGYLPFLLESWKNTLIFTFFLAENSSHQKWDNDNHKNFHDVSTEKRLHKPALNSLWACSICNFTSLVSLDKYEFSCFIYDFRLMVSGRITLIDPVRVVFGVFRSFGIFWCLILWIIRFCW